MKRWIVVGLAAVLVGVLVFGALADPIHIGGGPTVTSSPIHIGGGPRLLSSPIHIGGGPQTLSSPIHIGGGPWAE
jgi:hypothetical protein